MNPLIFEKFRRLSHLHVKEVFVTTLGGLQAL